LEVRLGTKPIAPRSSARITSLVRSEAETTTTGTAGQVLRNSSQHLEAVDFAEREVEQDEVDAVVLAQHLARRPGGFDADHGDVVAEALDHAAAARPGSADGRRRAGPSWMPPGPHGRCMLVPARARPVPL
jgi:hypothetical protein